MKKYWFKSTVFAAVLSTLTACSDFGDINVNPNNPSTPSTPALLTGAIRNVGAINGQVGPGSFNMTPALYVQQFGDVTYIEDSRYKTINFSYNGLYTGPLLSLQEVIDLNTNEATKTAAAATGSNANQIAIARILKAYFFQFITDRWGDVPYSQALKANQNFTPAFDKQQDIYNDLFKEWKEAAAQFDGGATAQGDILLNGNAARWKKFANSLRLIAALRLSKVDPAKGKAEFAAALADGVFTSNADNVQYNYLSEANNENPLYNNYITTNRKDFALSNTFVDYLKKVNDPRLPFLADKNINGEYRGVPYGAFPAQGKAQDFSLAATAIRQQNSPVNVLTYGQVLLAQAEAAKLGWTSGNAKSLYESAVKASMQQWMGAGYTEAAYTAYIAQPDVAYSETNAIERIATQRWIHLFFQGTEAWNEWRRTGYPQLKPTASTLNGGTEIPRRLAYPVTEVTLNKANYDAVISRQGKDDQYTRVWWDK
ncbi:SusD/RagB family nutrient-binding outer membrane lipoprotein [Fibrisoma montanum]|uniref:SusD/RagB family nutrient-binding outer membrane lipoprotein n=1 Tax=Fibrisoma montanum TaxID=2305895 RepID=A0A418MEY3_9BACT|nr:SusD/RagB family nutrient-binding outer membrane lipoprotein [Fibrisoma montanum]RIV25370.1 SusD/RagB family nutrient-binding outer membrane lipoprotein [Fibrisoma montanum]